MDRWVGKVAVVTGASSGIGAKICIDLATAGVIVAGLARRQHRIEELKKNLPPGVTGKIHAIQCDVSKEDDIKRAFGWVEKNLGGVDILVNNAGTIRQTSLLSPNNSQPIREIFDINVLAIVWCTREAFQSMKNRETAGHVVLINSIAGHSVPIFAGTGLPSLNVYPSSKYAVTAINEVLRQEFQTEGNRKTKVTVLKINFINFSLTYF